MESLFSILYIQVVRRAEDMQARELPRTAEREKGKEKVGFASQALNAEEIPGQMSSWITGM